MSVNKVKNDLYKILQEEYVIYTDLLEILKRERDAIIDDDIRALINLIGEGEEKVHSIKFLEDERMSLLKKFLPIEKLDSFVEMLPDPEEKKKFLDLQNNLLLRIEEIDYLRKSNELIINKTLKYLRFYIELLSKEIGSPIYGKEGDLNFNKNFINSLDKRV